MVRGAEEPVLGPLLEAPSPVRLTTPHKWARTGHNRLLFSQVELLEMPFCLPSSGTGSLEMGRDGRSR